MMLREYLPQKRAGELGVKRSRGEDLLSSRRSRGNLGRMVGIRFSQGILEKKKIWKVIINFLFLLRSRRHGTVCV